MKSFLSLFANMKLKVNFVNFLISRIKSDQISRFTLVENSISKMQVDFNKGLKKLDEEFEKMRNKIPEAVLAMKWGDLEEMVSA